MNNSSRIELFVPGRLCLFGEHSDWAGANRAFNADILPGRAIVCGTQEGIYATAEKSELFSVDYALDNQEDVSFSCPMDAEALRLEAHTGKYYSYVAGVASYICEWYHVGGVKITITRRDLPLKKGLSSSAAICVLVAQAFNQLYNLNLSTLGVMNIAYMGEQRTPSRCGRLDQACAFGNVPVAMEFDGSEISAERISVKKPLYFVFADLNAKKDTVKILADLNSAYPFPRRDEDRKLHELLGADNRDITGRAVEYIKNGETEKLGALMTYAQQLFDEKAAPLCPEELTAPVLHSVLRDENIRSMTCGCKGVGSQGDGTAQFLAKDRENQLQLIQYLESRGMTAFALTIKPAQAVRKAIIPLAGFGTRMYPATRFIKKELCPVADSDGLVKPALLVLLEELDSAGIEEICLIINPGDRALYESLLFTPLSDRHYSSLPAQMQRYEQKYQRMIKKIRFAYQNEPRGFATPCIRRRSLPGTTRCCSFWATPYTKVAQEYPAQSSFWTLSSSTESPLWRYRAWSLSGWAATACSPGHGKISRRPSCAAQRSPKSPASTMQGTTSPCTPPQGTECSARSAAMFSRGRFLHGSKP